MKKILLASLLVLAAVCTFRADAAAVDVWNTNMGLTLPDSSTLASGTLMAYLLKVGTQASSSIELFDMDVLEPKSVDLVVASVFGTGSIKASFVVDSSIFVSDVSQGVIPFADAANYPSGGLDNGESYALLFAFENADTGDVWYNYSDSHTTSEETIPKFGTEYTYTFDINIYENPSDDLDVSAGSVTGWIRATPEPTSGLLVLVGAGLLALRRRRSAPRA